MSEGTEILSSLGLCGRKIKDLLAVRRDRGQGKVEAGIAQIGLGLHCQYIIMIGPPNQGHGFLKGKRFKTFWDNNVMLSNIVHGVEKPFD